MKTTISLPLAAALAAAVSSPASALGFAEAYALKNDKIAAEIAFAARGAPAGGIVASALALRGQGENLLADLQGLGLARGARAGRLVAGWLPWSAVPKLERLASLHSIKPAAALYHAARPLPPYYGPQGAVVSQGDKETFADKARARFGVDGAGVKVGVLSNSYNCATDLTHTSEWAAESGVASGDLPHDVEILKDRKTAYDWEKTGEADCPRLKTGRHDEGRAMLEIVHDLAPGASLAFHTSSYGAADFAAGILALADAGATVIVDDTTYLDEPVWQDGGPVADAVQAVVKRGVTYIAAAGNFGRQTYEAPFRPSGVTREIGGQSIEWKEYVKATGSGIINTVDRRVTTPTRRVELHDFDPGPGVDICQNLELDASGVQTWLALHWNQPYASVGDGPGADTDLDVFLMDENCENVLVRHRPDIPENFAPGHLAGTPLDAAMAAANNLGGDPVETLAVTLDDAYPTVTTAKYGLAIGRAAGPAPSKMRLTFSGYLYQQKYAVSLASNLDATRAAFGGDERYEWAQTGPTLFGHANLPEAIAVGAVRARTRHVWPSPANGWASYAQLLDRGDRPTEPFSALGGAEPLFDGQGAPLARPPGRKKPDVAGVDGVENRAFGHEYGIWYLTPGPGAATATVYYGTSAAAAHVAGAVALAKQAKPAATPAQIAEALRRTAQPLDDSLAPTGKPGFNYATGYGLADAENLIALLLGQAPTARPSVPPATAGAGNAAAATDCTAGGRATSPYAAQMEVNAASQARLAALRALNAAVGPEAKAQAQADLDKARCDLQRALDLQKNSRA